MQYWVASNWTFQTWKTPFAFMFFLFFDFPQSEKKMFPIRWIKKSQVRSLNKNIRIYKHDHFCWEWVNWVTLFFRRTWTTFKRVSRNIEALKWRRVQLGDIVGHRHSWTFWIIQVYTVILFVEIFSCGGNIRCGCVFFYHQTTVREMIPNLTQWNETSLFAQFGMLSKKTGSQKAKELGIHFVLTRNRKREEEKGVTTCRLIHLLTTLTILVKV